MRTTAWISIAMALSVLAGQAAMADHPRNPIKQGLRSGELTKRDSKELERQCKELDKRLDEASAETLRQNRDAQP